jgi:hypothetical protein
MCLAKGFIFLAEGVDVLLLVEDDPIRKFVLCENNFGWMDAWELNPERMGSLWLKA